jgi:hypothetical protein
MTLSSGSEALSPTMLQEELAEGPRGYLVRLRGDLVCQTAGVLWGIETVLPNGARVALDFLDVRSVDQAGMTAALSLVEAVHAFGGRVTLRT